MDALINWASGFVTLHPKVAAWLTVLLMIDQVLKVLKNSFKLNIPDNFFDAVGDLINKVLSKATLPKQ